MSEVSIITPTYNSEKVIGKTIESILSQSYSDWELLITDDCSSDNTWRILTEYAVKDPRIKLFRLERNAGAGVARNNSIKHATGRYIAFCDADDCWLPEKLETQLAFMKEHSQEFSYSSYYVCDEHAVITGEVHAKKCLNYRDLLRNNYVGCLTAIYDADVLGKRYFPEIRKRQDWGLWLAIFKDVDSIHGISEPLAVYMKRTDSISSNKLEMFKYNWKIYREIERFSAIRSCFLMVSFLWFYFKKKFND